MRATIVHNPVAGRTRGSDLADRATRGLAAAGWYTSRIATDAGGAWTEALDHDLAGGASRIVAIGGDGTVAEVAERVIEAGSEAAVAVVPAGTANVLALNLGIPTRPRAAIETAVGGRRLDIDCGRMNGRLFVLSAGIGFHAEIVAATDRPAKRRWGVAAYGMAGLRAGRGIKPARIRIEMDGREEVFEATMIQVMNCGSIFSRALAFAPGVSPVDGVLDVIVYWAATVSEAAATAARWLSRTPTGTDLVTHRTASRVNVGADPAVRVQRDGEPAGRTPVEIETLPGAVGVLVPEGSEWVR